MPKGLWLWAYGEAGCNNRTCLKTEGDGEDGPRWYHQEPTQVKTGVLAKKTEKEGITSSSWFIKGDTAKVVKCQATPGGPLAQKIEKNLNKGSTPKERIKVIEEGGAPATTSLKRSDPVKETGCRFRDPKYIVDGR